MTPTEPGAAHRVLLVDDDGAVRAMMNEGLQRKGFEVTTAASVTEALRRIATESFDVLINRGMEIWKTLRVSHIPTPPATTTDNCLTRRYTNIPLGTKDRSGHDREGVRKGRDRIGECDRSHSTARGRLVRARTSRKCRTWSVNSERIHAGHEIPLVVAVAIRLPTTVPPLIDLPHRIPVPLPPGIRLQKLFPELFRVSIHIAPKTLFHLLQKMLAMLSDRDYLRHRV